MLIDKGKDGILSPSSIVVDGFNGALREKLKSWVSGNSELFSSSLGTCVVGIEL